MAEDVAAGRLHMDADVDTTGVARGLQRRVDAEVRNVRARLRAEIDTSGVATSARKAAAEASRTAKVRFTAEVDTRGVIAAARAAAAEASRSAVITFKADVDAKSVAEAKRKVSAVAESRVAKVTVDANTARATAKVEALRALAGRNVDMGVNVPSGGSGAMSGMGQAGQQAAAGASAAAAGVSAFATQLQKLGGIAAIVGGVYQLGVAAVQGAGGLFSMAASASQAVYAIAALPSVVAMAMQGIGALIIGFSGIGAAVGALSAQHESLGQTQIKQASQAQSNARAEQAAARQVQSAQQAIGNARRAAADATIAAAQRISDAEWGLREAHVAAAQAQKDLNQARKDAKQNIIDLDRELIKSRHDETLAADALLSAQEHLQDVMWNKSSTDREKRDAQDAVTQARDALKEARQHHKDVQKEDAKSDKQGVEGSDSVKAAKWRVVEANHAIMTSERELANARRAQAETRIQNAQSIASAEQNLKVAQQALADAHKKAATDAATQTAQYLALQSAMSNLSPAGREFAKFIYGLKGRWDRLHAAVQEALLPPIQEGITRALPLLDVLQKGLVGTATVIGGFVKRLGTLMGSGGFGRDISGIMTTNNKALRLFLDAAMHLVHVLVDVAAVAGPTLLVPFAKWVKALTAGWQATVQADRKTGKLHDTFVRARKGVHLLWSIITNLAGALHGVGKAATPAGTNLLHAFNRATRGWEKWTKSDDGQKKLQRFFRSAKRVTKMLGRIFDDLMQTLGKLADTGGGPLMGFLGVLHRALQGLNKILGMPGIGKGVGWLLTLAGAAGGIAWVAGAIMKMVRALRLLWIIEKIGALFTMFNESLLGTRIGLMLLAVQERVAAAAAAFWTPIQIQLDAAIDANPIGMLVLALMALAAVFIVMYKKVGWFRDAVNATMKAIVVAFKWLVDGAKWLWDVLFGHSIFPDMLAAFKVIFGAIGKVIGVWWALVKVYFKLLMLEVKIVMKIIGWLWTHAFKPAFHAIGKVVGWLWNNVIKPIFKLWKAEFRVIGAIVKWLWDKMVKPYFNFIAGLISKAWKTVIKPTWDAFVRGVKIIGGWIRDLWRKYVSPAWTSIRDFIEDTWKKRVKPVFDALGKFVKTTLPNAFRDGIRQIKTWWDGLRKIASAPVGFLVNTVYSKGIRPMIDAIPGVGNLPDVHFNYARGTSRALGVLPGYSPGRDNYNFVSTDGRMRLGLGGGEGILRPEVVRGLGARTVDYLNSAARMGHTALKRALAAVSGSLSGRGGDFGAPAPGRSEGTPSPHALARLFDSPAAYRVGVRTAGAVMKYAGGGVLDPNRVQAALKFAHDHDYAGYSMADRVGPNNFDCSGFMGAITNVLQGYSNPYQSRGTTATFPWGGFKPGVGEFTIGSANPYPGSQYGHMAGTLAGTNVESRGDVGVIVGSGARGYNDPGFRVIGHLGKGGKDAAGGGWFDAFKKAISAAKDFASNIGGWVKKLSSFQTWGDMFANSIKNVAGSVKDWVNGKIPGPGPIPSLFDRGGSLYPGSTLSMNRTGKTETVFTNENMVDMSRYLAQVARSLNVTVEAQQNDTGALVEHLTLVGKPSEMPGLLSDATYELRRIQRGGVHASRAARRPARVTQS